MNPDWAGRPGPHHAAHPRRVGTDDETFAELTVLAGYDADFVGPSTGPTTRLRDALVHVHLGRWNGWSGCARTGRRARRGFRLRALS